MKKNFNILKKKWRKELLIYREEVDPNTIVEAAEPSYAHKSGLIAWIFWKRIYHVVKYLNSKKRIGRTLDFGCGLGIMLPFLQKLSDDVSGVDLFIKPAKDLQVRLDFEDVKLYEDPDLCLDQKNKKYNTILALDVLEHIDDLSGLINKFINNIEHGGKILISGPTENWLYKIGRFVAGFHKVYKNFEYASESSNPHHNSTIYDIEKKIKLMGLKVRTIKTLYYPVPIFKIIEVTI